MMETAVNAAEGNIMSSLLGYVNQMSAQQMMLVIAAVCLLLVALVIWGCWFVWLERFVVYSADGAHLRLDIPDMLFDRLAEGSMWL